MKDIATVMSHMNPRRDQELRAPPGALSAYFWLLSNHLRSQGCVAQIRFDRWTEQPLICAE